MLLERREIKRLVGIRYIYIRYSSKKCLFSFITNFILTLTINKQRRTINMPKKSCRKIKKHFLLDCFMNIDRGSTVIM